MWWWCPRILRVCSSLYLCDEDTIRCCWQHLWRGVECEECGGGDQEYLEYVNLAMSETKVCCIVA